MDFGPQPIPDKRSGRAAWIGGFFTGAAALLLTGCQSTSPYRDLPLTGDPIQDGLIYIEQGPPKDKVLWQYRTALRAMRKSDFELSERLFDDAILNLGGMMQPDRTARQSRSYFQEESRKTFYGEPYERVMAWYYRGILYWMDGEIDNARACFRSAQFQDSDAENNEYRSDYVILDYMDGFATTILGGDGSDHLERARELSESVSLPAYNTEANVLFFIDFGAAPIKYGGGEYGEKLRFRQGVSPVKAARLKWNDGELYIAPVDDLYYQAITRGGRVMDHVLGNQAVFKKTTDTIGDAAMISGAVLASQRDTQEAGLIVLGAGVLTKLFASATRPEADTRYWHNLPQYLSFAILKMPPGERDFTVEFLDGQGRVLPEVTKQVTVLVEEQRGPNVFYISDQSTQSQEPEQEAP
ncbi:MAG: hypothetical protein R3236_11880 [Phycisphaeraceae bacterium]|nr:hypothetical protein [Phycisphaeraceae bacterium]